MAKKHVHIHTVPRYSAVLFQQLAYPSIMHPTYTTIISNSNLQNILFKSQHMISNKEVNLSIRRRSGRHCGIELTNGRCGSRDSNTNAPVQTDIPPIWIQTAEHYDYTSTSPAKVRGIDFSTPVSILKTSGSHFQY